MPRFTGQNKKNVNPRWFMDEKQEIVKEEIDFDKLDDMSDDDERESIRGLSKDLTGKKDSYMIPDNFESMSREELIDLVKDMMASPEGQDFEREMRDEEDREIGMQDDELDNSPKRLGMGRMKEDLSDREWSGRDMYDDDGRVDPIQMREPTTFQQKLSDQLEDWRSDNLTDLINRGKLDLVNSYIDRLDADRVEEKVAKAIADALEKGENPFY